MLLANAANGAGTLLSSATQTVNGSGDPTLAVSDWLMSRGGPCKNGPASAKPMNGGVFPPASTKGEITQLASSLNGTAIALPLATIVHVSFLSCPKSLGTVMVNTPHWRPTRK